MGNVNADENSDKGRCDCPSADGCEHGDWSRWAAMAEDEINQGQDVDPEVERHMRENASG